MMTRDQRRAVFAYERVLDVPVAERDEYRSAVRNLGPLVMRSGLSTALAVLQRNKEDQAIKLLFEHLARADIAGLKAEADRAPDELPERARRFSLDETMLATRELLKVVEWLKRAVEASF